MNSHILGYALSGAVVLASAAMAQNPQTPSPQAPAPPTTAPATGSTTGSQDRPTMVTVEGCLVREADVPGRKPNIAERAGVTEDYILTSTKMVKGTAPAASLGSTRSASAMYEVEGISEADLKTHLGRRVQIDGTFANTDRAKPSTSEGANEELVELRGSVIRSAAGDCTAK